MTFHVNVADGDIAEYGQLGSELADPLSGAWIEPNMIERLE